MSRAEFKADIVENSPNPNFEATSSNMDVVAYYDVMRRRANEILSRRPEVTIFRFGGGWQWQEKEIGHLFLRALPTPELQQKFNCSICRSFLETIGTLGYIDAETGIAVPLFWNSDEAPAYLRKSVRALEKVIASRKAVVPFEVYKREHLKVGKTGSRGFSHMEMIFPERFLVDLKNVLLPIHPPVSLGVKLDRLMLNYSDEVLYEAIRLIHDGILRDSRKYYGMTRWLKDNISTGGLLARARLADIPARDNLCTLAATQSFTGCIINLDSGPLGQLLKLLKANVDLEEIVRLWDGIIRYPHRKGRFPPRDSFARVIYARGVSHYDLCRKFLTLDDVPKTAWMFQEKISKPSRRANLKAIVETIRNKLNISRQPSTLICPTVVYGTFASFMSDYVPHAKQIHYLLPSEDHIFFLVTGQRNARAVLEWEIPQLNYRASHYVYNDAEPVNNFNLKPGWVKVRGILPFPHHWPNMKIATKLPLPFHGLDQTQAVQSPDASPSITPESPTSTNATTANTITESDFTYGIGTSYLLALDDVQDPSQHVPLCLFPDHLVPNLRPIRRDIEAYSNANRIEHPTDPKAKVIGGIRIQRSDMPGATDSWQKQVGNWTKEKLQQNDNNNGDNDDVAVIVPNDLVKPLEEKGKNKSKEMMMSTTTTRERIGGFENAYVDFKHRDRDPIKVHRLRVTKGNGEVDEFVIVGFQ